MSTFSTLLSYFIYFFFEKTLLSILYRFCKICKKWWREGSCIRGFQKRGSEKCTILRLDQKFKMFMYESGWCKFWISFFLKFGLKQCNYKKWHFQFLFYFRNIEFCFIITFYFWSIQDPIPYNPTLSTVNSYSHSIDRKYLSTTKTVAF